MWMSMRVIEPIDKRFSKRTEVGVAQNAIAVALDLETKPAAALPPAGRLRECLAAHDLTGL